MESRKIQLLRSVYSLLQYHRTIGIKGYSVKKETLTFLQTWEAIEPGLPADQAISRNPQKKDREGRQNQSVASWDDTAEEIRTCTDCSLHAGKLAAIPGRGNVNRPKILFVGGWLIGERGSPVSRESVFGIEEDTMLSRMVSAINLSSEDVFITNLIKCAITKDSQPSVENINTCFSYLRRQIHIFNPVLVCSMGISATKALVKSTKPLSQLRGKIYHFTVSKGRNIPVVPTYHPTFLLKNLEFKRATWEDLKIIEKYLR